MPVTSRGVCRLQWGHALPGVETLETPNNSNHIK